MEVDLAEPNTGVTMRVRHATTHIPMNTVPLGTKVYLSIEFVKGKNEGKKNLNKTPLTKISLNFNNTVSFDFGRHW